MTRLARSANCMGSSKPGATVSFLGSIPIPFLPAHSSTFISYATPSLCLYTPVHFAHDLWTFSRKCKPPLDRN